MTFNPLSASLEKGGGLPQGKPEGFHRNLRNLKRMCVTFNPSVRSWTRVQLPFQGSLNNPSVCSRCSQSAPDGSPSPLSLRDISPHRGESPFTREPEQSLSLFVDSRPAPDGRESPLSLRDISPHCGESPYVREPFLSLRDISPHCGESPFSREPFVVSPHRGESPYLREPKSPLFLPENTVKMFKTVFNTCQKVQNSKTLTICS